VASTDLQVTPSGVKSREGKPVKEQTGGHGLDEDPLLAMLDPGPRPTRSTVFLGRVNVRLERIYSDPRPSPVAVSALRAAEW
jgi:hypothetical protein